MTASSANDSRSSKSSSRKTPGLRLSWSRFGSDFAPACWRSLSNYCELAIIYLLGIGSPTHPLPPASFQGVARDINDSFPEAGSRSAAIGYSGKA